MGSFSEIFDGLMSGHRDDEEVFSETCQSSGVFLQSDNASRHETRSSRASTGKLPTLVLDDLISWHEELPDYRKTPVEDGPQKWTRGTRQDTTSQKQKPQVLKVENAMFF